MSTGIARQPVGSWLKIFPNPLGDGEQWSVEFSRLHADVVLQLFNAQGALIYSQTADRTQQSVQINAAQLPSGLYLLKVTGMDFEKALRVQVL